MFAVNSAGSEHPSGSGDYSTTEQHFDTIVPVESQLPVNPSTCVFWAAVALGSLVRGRPIESVSRYSRLAKDVLAKFSGPANADVARAWAILAYMSDFSGDNDNFQVYLKRAKNVLNEVGEEEIQTLPVGFADTVKHGDTIKMFNGGSDRDEVESFGNQERANTQTNMAITEGDICRILRKAQQETERIIYEEIIKAKSTPHPCMPNGGPCIDSASTHKDGADSLKTPSPRGFDSPTREQGAGLNLSSLLEAVKTKLREDGRDFERLERDVNRWDIQEGAVGLLINGTIALGKAARKDTRDILQNLGQCAQMFDRYPGLCRATMGLHGTHVLTTCLAAIDSPTARGMYDQMTAAYNSALRPGSQAIPPFDEWQGVSAFCDHLFCGLMECIILGEDTFVLPPPPLQEPVTEPPLYEHAAERYEKDANGVPVHEREQSMPPSARGPLEASDENPSQTQHRTMRAPMVNRTPDGSCAERVVEGMEAMTKPEERLPSPTHPEHPIEHPKLVTAYPSTLLVSVVDRTVGDHDKASDCTEYVAEAHGSFWSSELHTLDGMTDETECEDIEAEDWLDVTHAMWAIGRSGLDCEPLRRSV